MTQEELFGLLHEVIHPERQGDIVTLGMIENPTVTPDKIQFSLVFNRNRDPFAAALKKRCEELIVARHPEYAGNIHIFIKENPNKKPTEPHERTVFGSDGKTGRIVAISSAKGGVGKSTVTANLAVALSKMGYRVGLLDADIYGPSQPMLFDIEGYQPDGIEVEGHEWIRPAERFGILIMSIGFFINPKDALMWRGPMAINALRQMIRQTLWGELDFLLIDMPPGTGDIHLSILQEMSLSGAIIVSTPQKMALADVVRGISMFRNEKIGIPVLGLVENMAWFTPEELPDHKYYLFGKEGTKRLAEEEHLPLLAQIPLIQNIRESSDEGKPVSTEEGPTSEYYRLLAKRMIEELDKQQQHGKL